MLEYTTALTIAPGLGFAERETSVNRQIQQHRNEIEGKGFVYLDHRVNNRSDRKVSVTFFYR